MKRWQKMLLGVGAGLVVAGAAPAAWVGTAWDRVYDVEGPDLSVSREPGVIERGRYLVHGPAHCSNCHVATIEDMARSDAGESIPMKGGLEFPLGPVGTLSMANLTPDAETGIGRYTDRQLFRLLRHGVKPDGTATLWPLMPFQHMADDDLVAIVSYLRTLEPVYNPVPGPRYTMMGKAVRAVTPPFRPILGHTAPAIAPAEAPTAERGEYLARYVANCVGCHTAHSPATMEFTGPDFAGGAEFGPLPGSDLWHRAPNLTPAARGLLVTRYPTMEAWVERFRAGRTLPESPMHWGPFSRMSQADLEALYLFFSGLDPVENDVGPTTFRKGEAN